MTLSTITLENYGSSVVYIWSCKAFSISSSASPGCSLLPVVPRLAVRPGIRDRAEGCNQVAWGPPMRVPVPLLNTSAFENSKQDVG